MHVIPVILVVHHTESHERKGKMRDKWLLVIFAVLFFVACFLTAMTVYWWML